MTASSPFRNDLVARTEPRGLERLGMTRVRGRATGVLVSVVLAVALVAAAASSRMIQGRVGSALDALGGADPNWPAAAGLGFLLAFACTVAAWRAALAASGGTISPRQAAARLGVGSLVNAVAPAKLGDALKIALFARAIDAPGRLRTAGGVYTALAGARALALAAVVVAASATGAVPLWPVFVLCGVVAVVAGFAAGTSRRNGGSSAGRVLDGLAALVRSPRALVAVLGWTFAMAGMRLVGAAAITVSLGLPHPVLAALVVVPALDLAGIVPLTPGSFGIGSGAVAVALAARGISGAQALGVGIAIQSVETAVSVAVGTVGSIYLLQPNVAFRRWSARLATAGVSVGLAAAVGLAVFDLA